MHLIQLNLSSQSKLELTVFPKVASLLADIFFLNLRRPLRQLVLYKNLQVMRALLH